MYRTLIGLLVLVVAAPPVCAQDDVRVVTEGMLLNEVIETLGQPDSISTGQRATVLRYRNKCQAPCKKGCRQECRDDTVLLLDGRVAAGQLTAPRVFRTRSWSEAESAGAKRITPEQSGAHLTTRHQTAIPQAAEQQVTSGTSPSMLPAPSASAADSHGDTRAQSSSTMAVAERARRRTDPDRGSTANRSSQRRVTFQSSVSGVFDSNLHRSQDPVPAQGMVTEAGVRFRSSQARPAIEAEYDIALHSYDGSSEWDRISQHVRGSFNRRLNKSLSLDAIGDVSVKGTSEDRDLGDQYMLSPRLSYRLNRADRLRLVGAYRWKRLANASLPLELNRYVEVEFTDRRDDRSWEFSHRWESNESRNDRRQYTRWTYASAFTSPVSVRDEVTLEAKYRVQRYDNRTIDIDGDEVVRRDHRWIPAATWTHTLPWGLAVALEYRYEARSSNDPDKEYSGHWMMVNAKRTW